MKVFKDCWNQIAAHEAQYGAHLFDGETMSIYVAYWLDVSNEIRPYFSRRNKEGWVGHCLLVFKGVKKCDILFYKYNVYKYSEYKPISLNYTGTPKGPTSTFGLAGSFKGFIGSVDIEIEAESFELHVLDRDEPAREE
jgi:hypothetical protein